MQQSSAILTIFSPDLCAGLARFALAFALLAGVLTAEAPAVDVPTWSVNDAWSMERTFDVDAAVSASLTIRVSSSETSRLSVVEIGDRTTTQAGTVRVYRRVRSNGALTGSGTATIEGVPLRLRWKPGSTTAGEEWLAVGDLAMVHDELRVHAEIQAQVLILWLTIATVDLDWATDSGPPRETYDFPLTTVGEQWRTSVTEQVYGRVQVAFNHALAAQLGITLPDDIDLPFEYRRPRIDFSRYTGTEPRGSYPATHHIVAPTSVSIWYEPSIKDAAASMLPELELTSGTKISNLSARITSATLAPEANVAVTGFTPPRPSHGSAPQLTGTTAPGTTVTATIVGEGIEAQGRADDEGRFEIQLTAPDHDDQSPASDDAGSFGVEMLAQGVGRKVATLQVERSLATIRGRWSLYR